jgi:hypothetical protein
MTITKEQYGIENARGTILSYSHHTWTKFVTRLAGLKCGNMNLVGGKLWRCIGEAPPQCSAALSSSACKSRTFSKLVPNVLFAI